MMGLPWQSQTCIYVAITAIMSIIFPIVFDGPYYILCPLPWLSSLLIWFTSDTIERCKYSPYGQIKRVQYFKTSEQYRTLLVIQSDYNHRETGKKGKVIAHLSAILPTPLLLEYLGDVPDTVIEFDGSHVEILYTKYNMTRLLLEAMEDWFPQGIISVGVKIDEVEAPRRTEERTYILFDVKNLFVPEHDKGVCDSNFLLIFSKEFNFTLKIGDTILDNVEGYVKIVPSMLNMPVATRADYILRESRLFAQKLEKGLVESDVPIDNWINKDVLYRRNISSRFL